MYVSANALVRFKVVNKVIPPVIDAALPLPELLTTVNPSPLPDLVTTIPLPLPLVWLMVSVSVLPIVVNVA
jgi:hypothetical protein